MDDSPLSTPELAALKTKLRLMSELLAAKDGELAAKDEVLGLLREKVARLERPAPRAASPPDPRDGFHFVSALEDPWAGPGGRGVPKPRRAQVREEAPKGLWARFYHWFREA